MMYKLVTNKKVYFIEDNRKPIDHLKFPKEITKFRFWLWLFNPNVKVYVFNDEKNRWDNVFYWPYRKLLK